jgi:hypothetical protein
MISSRLRNSEAKLHLAAVQQRLPLVDEMIAIIFDKLDEEARSRYVHLHTPFSSVLGFFSVASFHQNYPSLTSIAVSLDISCREFLDGYWWDHATKVDFVYHRSGGQFETILRKATLYHKSLRQITVESWCPKWSLFKRFMSLVGPQLRSVIFPFDSAKSHFRSPRDESDSLLVLSLKTLNAEQLENFHFPSNINEVQRPAVMDFCPNGLSSLKIITIHHCDFEIVEKILGSCICLEEMALFDWDAVIDDALALVRDNAKRLRHSLKRVEISFMYYQRAPDTLFRALRISSSEVKPLAWYEKRVSDLFAVPLANFTIDGDYLWNAFIQLAADEPSRDLAVFDGIFDACFPCVLRASKSLAGSLWRFDALTSRQVEYFSLKIESMVGKFDFNFPAHTEAYVHLESTFISHLVRQMKRDQFKSSEMKLEAVAENSWRRLLMRFECDCNSLWRVDHEAVLFLWRHKHLIGEEGLKETIFLYTSSATCGTQFLTAEDVSRLLQSLDVPPLRVRSPQSYCYSLFQVVVESWSVRMSEDWELCVSQIIDSPDPSEADLEAMSYVACKMEKPCIKLRSKARLLARILKRLSTVPRLGKRFVEQLLSRKPYQAWDELGPALMYRPNIRDQSFFTEQENALFADAVWCHILSAAASEELLQYHVKFAQAHFYSIPAMVTKFSEEEIDLPFSTELSPERIRAVLHSYLNDD